MVLSFYAREKNGLHQFGVAGHADRQVAAGKDNGPVLAKYLAANPHSEVVSVLPNPSEAALLSVPEDRYDLAVYPDYLLG